MQKAVPTNYKKKIGETKAMASITKRANTYRIKVSNGINPDGTRHYEYATFIPEPGMTEKQTERALNSFVVDFERKVKQGEMYDGDKMTLKIFSAYYMTTKAMEHKQSTREEIERELRTHILPQLGAMKLSNIKPAHIQKFKAYLANADKRNGSKGKLSPKTQKRVFDTLSSILHYAEQLDIIVLNPCRKVGAPKLGSKKQTENFLTPEQAKSFLNHMAGENIQFAAIVYLAIYTGARLGELISLTWSDIDFKNHRIRISKSTSPVKGGQIITTPKSAASVRDVPLVDQLVPVLKKLKSFHQGEAFRLGDQYSDSGYLFRKWNGDQLHHDTPRRWINKYIVRYNELIEADPRLTDKQKEELSVTQHFTFHGLRHSSATLLLASGVDIKTVQSILGHSKASTTMDIYAHALEENRIEAVEQLAMILNA